MTQSPTALAAADRLTEGLSIRNRLIGAIVLILALFALACLVSLLNFESVNRARLYAGNANAMLLKTAELRAEINRQAGALRGYTLAGAKRYADAIDASTQTIEDLLHSLQDGSADNETQTRRLDRVDEMETRWQQTVAEPVKAQVETGQMKMARHTLIKGASVAFFDPIAATLAAYRARLRSDVAERNATLVYRRHLAQWSLFITLVIGLLIGLLTVRAIVRRVTRPLSELTDATQRLAAGERHVRVHFQKRQDEIGAVSRALEEFRRIILEQDREAWIRDERARLTVLLHHCKNEKDLGDELLRELAPLMGAGYTALLAPATLEEDETRFSLLASYGYDTTVETIFEPGQGLVGSVMETGRTVILQDVPDNYLPVRSGLGEAKPAVLLVAPALVNGRVIAVLEVALFRTPREQESALLESLLPNVALTLLTLMRARRTTELLEQSRVQTQALQESEQRLRDQQHNLEQVNVELRAQGEELNTQSNELRASEEELKVQADELKTANENLRVRQAEMKAQQNELKRLNEESRERAEALARANQYKTDFLANMSHELRTPLNSLLILSRSLADNDEGNLDDEQVEAARIIHDSGNNLLTLINDILDLSKIEAGKMRVEPQQISVARLASSIERLFEHVAASKGLQFVVDIAPDTPDTIVTDGGKVEQIVGNLVSNAIKFTQRGSVRVSIEPPSANMVFRTDALTPDNGLAIRVSDEGIGIPADRLEQIFQAFEQVDASTSRNYGGTGLGLSISRELARLLGGEITVESRPGEGSCFVVSIRRDMAVALADGTPEAAPDVTPTPEPKAPAPTDHKSAGDERPRLLIIDDDHTLADVVCKTACKRGFDCEWAADGERGLALAAENSPDAIVLDLGLPGIDGWTVLDRLKSDPATRDIPVHIVSAADDPGHSARAGAVGYLRKPLTREDLDKLLGRAETLSGRKTRKVLVIDDDRDAHAAVTRLLRFEATEIVSATTGEGALAVLDEGGFDCVVLELRLPDICGFELLERIATRPGPPPVVVYSARDLSEEETRSLRAHTDSIVIKGGQAQDRLLDEISLFMHRIEDRTPAAARLAQPQPDAALAGKTVLLVDDDMRNTFALSRLLRGRGLKVLMAADGYKALDQLEANDKIAIVLMDIMMPGMDGYETIRRIRKQAWLADLPVIALTAKAMAGDREKCLAAGATDYLPKPLDTDALIAHMRRFV